MAAYIYKISNGTLVSYNPGDSDPVADAATLAKGGLAVASGLPPIDDTHGWDAASKTIVTVAAPVKQAPPVATGQITIAGVTYKVTLS